MFRDGDLVWEDGTSATYTPWASTDPTDNGLENCVVTIQTGELWDEGCNRKFASYCSIPQPSLFGSYGAIGVALILLVIGFFAYKKFAAGGEGAYGNYGDPYGNYGPPQLYR